MEELSKVSLSFFNFAAEKEFSDSLLDPQKRWLKILVLSMVLQMGGIFSISPMVEDDYGIQKILAFIVLPSLLFIISLLVSVKRPDYSSHLICLIVLTCSILTSELLYQRMKNLESKAWIHFFLGNITEFNSFFLIFSNISWIKSLVLIAWIHIYTWFRVLELLDNLSAQKAMFCMLILRLLLIIVIARFGELMKRQSFLNGANLKRQVESLENILMNVIQSCMIFMKEGKVLKYNESMKTKLNVEESEEILDIFHTIKIKRKKDEYNNCLDDNLKHNQPKEEEFTLFELYKDCEVYAQETNQNFWPGFSVVEGEIEDAFLGKSKTFSIQMGAGVWKDEQGVLIIMTDVTEIKQYYKTLDGYKDNLLATVSHDLRAPLNGILGMLSLLLEETEEESKRDKINISIVSAKLLQNMINDILDFSLISKGKLKLKFETTNITSFLEETRKIMSLQAKMKGLHLEIENSLPSKCENHIVDQNRLRQVLLNLIGNAIKFTNQGGVFIRVREAFHEKLDRNNNEIASLKLDEVKEGSFYNSLNKLNEKKERGPSIKNLHMLKSSMFMVKKQLIFEVEDTGVGIKPEDITKLFKLFSRVTTGHDKNMSGIGLGLAISQSLVMMMNNNKSGAIIRAESVFGKGSRFSFPLNIENEPSEFFKEVLDERFNLPLFFEAKSLNIKSLGEKQPKIANEAESLIFEEEMILEVLVVDDDQINLLVASNFLKSEAKTISFLTAVNGEDALEKVKSNANLNKYFDIILMDCQMPILDGYQTSRILKNMMREKSIPLAPIIALTANNTNADRQRCHEFGMDLFLAKPYTKLDLLKIISEAKKLKKKWSIIS